MEMIAILSPDEKQDSLEITIPLQELEEKSQQVGVSNILPFLDSELFKENKFTYNPEKKEISRLFLVAPTNEQSFVNTSLFVLYMVKKWLYVPKNNTLTSREWKGLSLFSSLSREMLTFSRLNVHGSFIRPLYLRTTKK